MTLCKAKSLITELFKFHWQSFFLRSINSSKNPDLRMRFSSIFHLAHMPSWRKRTSSSSWRTWGRKDTLKKWIRSLELMLSMSKLCWMSWQDFIQQVMLTSWTKQNKALLLRYLQFIQCVSMIFQCRNKWKYCLYQVKFCFLGINENYHNKHNRVNWFSVNDKDCANISCWLQTQGIHGYSIKNIKSERYL